MFVVPPLGGVFVRFTDAAKAAKMRPLKWELRIMNYKLRMLAPVGIALDESIRRTIDNTAWRK